MKAKPVDALEALHVPELGVNEPESRAAALALAAAEARADELPGESDALRARVVGSASRGGRFGIYADRVARLFDISVDAALALLARVDVEASWRPGPAPGIELMAVRTGPKYPNAVAAIGRLAPGARFPRHAHLGEETTLVLAGGFRDSSGAEVTRGDALHEAPGTEHEFVVLDGEECIAAVVAVGGVAMR